MIVSSREQAKDILARVGRNISIDTETYTDGAPFPYEHLAQVFCISFAISDTEAYTIRPADYPWAYKFITALCKRATQIWMHNAKYDVQVLERHGTEVPRDRVLDTMIGAYIGNLGKLDTKTGRVSRSLKALAKQYFGVEYSFEWDDVRKAPIADLLHYAEQDAIITYRLARKVATKVRADGLWDHFVGVEMPTCWLLCDMSKVGVSIDADVLSDLDTKLHDVIEDCEKQAKDLTREHNPPPPYPVRKDGRYHSHHRILKAYWKDPVMSNTRIKYRKATFEDGVSLGSPTQINRYMYTKLRWWKTEGVKNTTSGAYETGKDAVEYQLDVLPPSSPGYKFALLKFKHSKATKLRSAFTSTLVEKASYYPDNKLRPTFIQVGTISGRFSCKEPNLQQLPRPGSELDDMPSIRSAIVASEGMVLWGCDYSQLEICVAAYFTKDPMLRKIVLEGASQHDITAAALNIERHKAKSVNFSLQYGAGPKKLAEILGMPLATHPQGFKVAPRKAKELWQQYHDTYGGVTAWREHVINACRKRGYVETLVGRRVAIPGIRSADKMDRLRAERQATNVVIQGSASDIIKLAALRLAKRWKAKNFPGYITLQIHDELVGEIDPAVQAEAAKDIKECMESPDLGDIPLTVEPVFGKSLLDCK